MIDAETTALVVPDQADPAPDGVVIMRGRRVHLRTLTRGDLAHLAEWVDDSYLDRMVGSDLLHAFKHQYDKGSEFYEACLTDPTQVVLIIVPNGGARPVGLVRLFNIHLLEGYAFLETIVADRRAMRRGFGIEAGRLIAAYGLDVLGLHRIEAKVYAYNVLSVNALRRNGFQQEGVLREAGFDGQRYWDVLVFGILRDEMEEQRKRDGVGLPFEGADGTVRDPA